MAKPRTSVKMLPDEDACLRALYRQYDIPTDQYPQRAGELTHLVETWNGVTGRRESPADVLHYMVTRRKKGKWEKLGRKAVSSDSVMSEQFSDDDLHHMDAIHEELQIASDNYALNTELAKKLQSEFAKRTGRIVPPMILAAAMITRRKAGALATLRPKPQEGDLGFADIDNFVG